MASTGQVTAIVPMRHSSERVPGKNYRDLGGKPLYQHVLDNLLATAGVGQVIIDTDSPTIMQQVEADYPSVTLVERPEHLRDGHTAMNDVLAHTLTHAVMDVVMQTHSTNPFVTPHTFQSAIERYFEPGEHDSVFGVTRIQGRLWSKDVAAINHDPAVLARTQDLDPVYLENSCFYVFSKSVFAATGNRLGTHPQVFSMDAMEAIDIDEEVDFLLAEAVEAAGLMSNR